MIGLLQSNRQNLDKWRTLCSACQWRLAEAKPCLTQSLVDRKMRPANRRFVNAGKALAAGYSLTEK